MSYALDPPGVCAKPSRYFAGRCGTVRYGGATVSKVRTAVLLVAIVGCLVSSVPPSPTAAAATAPQICRGGTLRVAYRDDPNILDPAMTSLSVTRFLAVVVYDTLFEYREPALGDVANGPTRYMPSG